VPFPLLAGKTIYQGRRNPMSKQLDKLKATMQRIEAQKAELDQKIKAQARKDRNHSIYQRGGELTMHLGDKAEVFTDEDVALFLKHVFSFTGIQKLLAQMREIRSGESRITMEQLFENARTTPQTAPQATRTEERFSATS